MGIWKAIESRIVLLAIVADTAQDMVFKPTILIYIYIYLCYSL